MKWKTKLTNTTKREAQKGTDRAIRLFEEAFVNPFNLFTGVTARHQLERCNALVEELLALVTLLLARWQYQVVVELFKAN